MQLHLRKICYLVKYQKKTSAFSLASSRHKITVNLAAAISSVSTQSIYAVTFNQTISFDGSSHCCPSMHTSALIDFSLNQQHGGS